MAKVSLSPTHPPEAQGGEALPDSTLTSAGDPPTCLPPIVIRGMWPVCGVGVPKPGLDLNGNGGDPGTCPRQAGRCAAEGSCLAGASGRWVEGELEAGTGLCCPLGCHGWETGGRGHHGRMGSRGLTPAVHGGGQISNHGV